MSTKSVKTKTFRFESIVLGFLSVCLLAALITYMYFIINSVVQIVLSQELNFAVVEVESRISELEAEYYMRANLLSIDTANDMGFVTITPHAYVEVSSPGDRLTRND